MPDTPSSQLPHRDAVFERLRQRLMALGPVCAQMTFLPGQLTDEGKRDLFMRAVEEVGTFIGGWEELAVPCAHEYTACMIEIEAEQQGAANMTGEAEG